MNRFNKKAQGPKLLQIKVLVGEILECNGKVLKKKTFCLFYYAVARSLKGVSEYNVTCHIFIQDCKSHLKHLKTPDSPIRNFQASHPIWPWRPIQSCIIKAKLSSCQARNHGGRAAPFWEVHHPSLNCPSPVPPEPLQLGWRTAGWDPKQAAPDQGTHPGLRTLELAFPPKPVISRWGWGWGESAPHPQMPHCEKKNLWLQACLKWRII